MKRHAFPLAVTSTIAALVLSGCGDDEPADAADDPASTPASETSEPTTDATTPTSEPTATETTETTTTSVAPVSVPVFFVADTPHGPALFAELRDLEAD